MGGISLAVGNLQTHASVAATVRLGLALPTNFRMQAPFLSEESLGLRPFDEAAPRSIYAFAGIAATCGGSERGESGSSSSA